MRLQRIVSVAVVNAKNCESCNKFLPTNIQIKWIDQSGKLCSNCPKCIEETAGALTLTHNLYRLAATKVAINKSDIALLPKQNINGWDKRVMTAYENWRDSGSNFQYLLDTCKDVAKQKAKYIQDKNKNK